MVFAGIMPAPPTPSVRDRSHRGAAPSASPSVRTAKKGGQTLGPRTRGVEASRSALSQPRTLGPILDPICPVESETDCARLIREADGGRVGPRYFVNRVPRD